MPTYEYKCTKDGSAFELWQEVGAPAPPCPDCGAPSKKVFHATRTIFKGAGFYVTDLRAESQSAKTKAPASDAGETPTEASAPAESSARETPAPETVKTPAPAPESAPAPAAK